MESLPAAWSISVDISFDYEVSVCTTVTRTLCGFNPGVLKQLSGCLLEVQASADCKWSPNLPSPPPPPAPSCPPPFPSWVVVILATASCRVFTW